MDVDRQPTKQKGFAKAFATQAKLEASVLAEPLTGSSGIWRFFTATRGMVRSNCLYRRNQGRQDHLYE